MKSYIGTKTLQAEPACMINGTIYLATSPMPRSMDRVEGYKVVYEDGYFSFSPKDVFEKAYKENGKLSIGDVAYFLEMGHIVKRSGWNGTDMFILKKYPSIPVYFWGTFYSLHKINESKGLYRLTGPHTSQTIFIGSEARLEGLGLEFIEFDDRYIDKKYKLESFSERFHLFIENVKHLFTKKRRK